MTLYLPGLMPSEKYSPFLLSFRLYLRPVSMLMPLDRAGRDRFAFRIPDNALHLNPCSAPRPWARTGPPPGQPAVSTQNVVSSKPPRTYLRLQISDCRFSAIAHARRPRSFQICNLKSESSRALNAAMKLRPGSPAHTKSGQLLQPPGTRASVARNYRIRRRPDLPGYSRTTLNPGARPVQGRASQSHVCAG